MACTLGRNTFLKLTGTYLPQVLYGRKRDLPSYGCPTFDDALRMP